MNEILDLMAQALGEVLANPVVGLVLRLVALGSLVLWVAAAWWVWRDARARTRDPIVPYLAAGAVIVATPFLFLPAAVVYRVVRPTSTVAAAESSALQVAMLEEASGRRACARCDEPVDDEWRVCPTCGATLSARCDACGRPLELDWRICAWCAADVPWEDVGSRESAGARPREPIAIPIRPGGRPLVPVMALPDDDGTADEQRALPARRPAGPRPRRG